MEYKSSYNRIFFICISGLGAGAMPDAKLYHCSNTNTLRSLFQTGKLRIPQLQRLGIGQINGLSFLGGNNYSSSFLAKLAQRSENKDRFTCLQELLGIVSAQKMPVYPYGIPSSLVLEIEKSIQSQIIGNIQCSKLNALMDFGLTHCETKKPILFTSYDSTISIAAHTSYLSIDHLNQIGLTVRRIMSGQHAVGRVVTVPFTGKWPYFTTTNGGKTFLANEHQANLLDVLYTQGFDVYSFGCFSLINHSFEFQNITYSNEQLLNMLSATVDNSFHGLCFCSLTEFESEYALKNDAEGMVRALNQFDEWLFDFISYLHSDDLLIITSDGGCDPCFTLSNERTREYAPFIAYGNKTYSKNLGIRIGLCDVAATIADGLNASYELKGKSIF